MRFIVQTKRIVSFALMILRFVSISEIYFGNVRLNFGDPRESVRSKLGGSYQEKNQTLSLGDSVAPMIQRRDIYDTLAGSTGNFFFLNYDENQLLAEIEVHKCEQIQVIDVVFDFESELDGVADRLSKYGQVDKIYGGYLFKELHICMEENMEENGTLKYFYCASDISHFE